MNQKTILISLSMVSFLSVSCMERKKGKEREEKKPPHLETKKPHYYWDVLPPELQTLVAKFTLNKNKQIIKKYCLTKIKDKHSVEQSIVTPEFLITFFEFGGFRIWNLNSKKPLKKFQTIDAIECFAVSPDNTLLVVGTIPGQVIIIDLRNYEIIKDKQFFGSIETIKFNSQGTLFYVSQDRSLQIWDAKKQIHLSTIQGLGGCFNISNEDNLILAQVGNKRFAVEDLKKQKRISTYDFSYEDSLFSKIYCKFSPNNKYFGIKREAFYIYNVLGTLLADFYNINNNSNFSFSNKDTLVAFRINNQIICYDIANKKVLFELPITKYGGHFSFTFDDAYLLAAYGSQIDIVDVKKAKLIYTLRLPENGHRILLSHHPQKKLFAATDYREFVYIFDIDKFEQINRNPSLPLIIQLLKYPSR